jgi:Zn-dependent metalloprotease
MMIGGSKAIAGWLVFLKEKVSMDARRVLALGLLLGCTTGTDESGEPAQAPFRVDRLDMHSQGTPFLMTGQLGRIAPSELATASSMSKALDDALVPIAEELRIPASDLVLSRYDRDELGTHVRYDQVKNGLPVIGGRVVVHIGVDGAIGLVTNSAREANVDPRPSLTADAAAAIARGSDSRFETGAPRLVYVITSRGGDLKLAWQVLVQGRGDDVLDDAKLYIDARTGALVDRHPVVYTAKNRTILNGGGLGYPPASTTTIGTEGSPPPATSGTDPNGSGLAAYDGTGGTYDCYKTLYNRDSYDNAGTVLRSVIRVTFGGSPNNAIWDSQRGQMAYGEGNGALFGPLAKAFDVTAHELTHAVTSATSDLIYADESGAMNEAMSDIMGAVCEAHRDQAVSANTWLIGEAILTPGTPGDALRYMADPVLDAPLYTGSEFVSSRDFLADKYNGNGDNGGVHFNSGIANLAFNLLTVGGKHPRNKTTHMVPAIGIEKAGKIFEYADTMLFNMNTGFIEARASTEMAAMMFYTGSEKLAVSLAWAAVGVGAIPPADVTAPTIDITNPTAGAQVLPGFQVTVTAADNVGILRIELSIDGMMVATSNTSPLTFTTPMTLAPGMHHVQATAFDAFNQTTDALDVKLAQVCAMDPECPMGEICESGLCTPGKRPEESTGCCDAGGQVPTGAFVLAFGTLLVLRRRRRR